MRLITTMVCCVALVVCVAAGASGAPAPSAANGVPLTRVNIAVLPLEPTAQIFYAHRRGFFRAQGIDARITVVSDPAQMVAAVLSGEAAFSPVNSGGLSILKTRGAPVKVVAGGALYRRNTPTTAVVAGPGKRIARARDLVGKRIGIDATNTIAHIGLLKWLKGNGVSAGDVRLVEIPFAQMLAPLRRGTIDAAILPEPYLTLATQRGATRVAHPFHAVCARDCLLTFFMARRDIDPNLAARFRNAVQAAAVWANKRQNDRASGAILARYAPIDAGVIREMTRTRFSERLRPAPAQPWIDAFAEFGVIPASFSALDLVK